VALPGMFLVRGRLVRTLQIISAREWSGIDAKDLMRSGALSSLLFMLELATTDAMERRNAGW